MVDTLSIKMSLILKQHINGELNVEGYPSESFLDLVLAVKPAQVTLVPDPPEALTSSFGWDLNKHCDYLRPIIERLKQVGIRTSLFVNPDPDGYELLPKIGTDRVELYTYDYAHHYATDKKMAIKPYLIAAEVLDEMGLPYNAGHDLNLDNLTYFVSQLTTLKEVSIGHAFVCDCFEYGLTETLKKYLQCLK